MSRAPASLSTAWQALRVSLFLVLVQVPVQVPALGPVPILVSAPVLVLVLVPVPFPAPGPVPVPVLVLVLIPVLVQAQFPVRALVRAQQKFSHFFARRFLGITSREFWILLCLPGALRRSNNSEGSFSTNTYVQPLHTEFSINMSQERLKTFRNSQGIMHSPLSPRGTKENP